MLQRYLTVNMTFSAITLAYMLRVSIPFVLTQMVVHPHRNSDNKLVGTDICPPFDDDIYIAPGATTNPFLFDWITITWEKFDWSQEQQGIIMSSFYWGFILSSIPGGFLAAKVGGKYAITFAMVIAVVFTILTPKAIELAGLRGLIAARAIVGVGEGTLFPACNTLLAAWTPVSERRITAIKVYSGIAVGSYLGAFVTGFVLREFGWKYMFYIFGGTGAFWLLLFIVLVYNNPRSHPFISRKERKYLHHELDHLQKRTGLPPTPWKRMFTSPPMLALIVAQMGHSWAFFIVVNEMPKYMNDVLRVSILKNGLYCAIPYVFMWAVTMWSGWLCDILIRKKYVGVTNARILFNIISSVGPAVGLLLVSYFGCNRLHSRLMFTVAVGCMGAYYAGVKANCMDLAPNYAGTVMAVVNGFGGATALVGLYVVALLTPNSYIQEWRLVFWVTFIILIATTVIYTLFASGEEQEWNEPDRQEDQDKVEL